MRTAAECLIKAAEMERTADSCRVAEIATDYQSMAVHWQTVARTAAWQDGFPTFDSEPVIIVAVPDPRGLTVAALGTKGPYLL